MIFGDLMVDRAAQETFFFSHGCSYESVISRRNINQLYTPFVFGVVFWPRYFSFSVLVGFGRASAVPSHSPDVANSYFQDLFHERVICTRNVCDVH